ncbi:MAG: hypothetical protein H6572_07825 [Lewinellaceae bacterium]|nr:hypothetical protein [Lewinellaceae bacterium]
MPILLPEAIVVYTVVSLFWKIDIIKAFSSAIIPVVEILSYFAVSVFIIWLNLKVFSIASSMKYSTYKDRIRFQWGLFTPKDVSIPFTDIISMNLVKYTNSHRSTIHFGTGKKYKINKFDFDTNEDRAHITFERILNVDEVYALLNKLWVESRK